MTSTAIERHTGTIASVSVDQGLMYRGRCDCGFSSEVAADRNLAEAALRWHIEDVTTPTLPTVTCTPWCSDGDGHPGQHDVADQWCGSESVRVPLSLYPTAGDAHITQDGRQAEPDFVSVCALRVPEEPVEIVLSRRLDRGIRLTPDEGQDLVKALQLVLGQIGR